jgi:outer membrane protein assembly factor BamD (BamD/ComL family)
LLARARTARARGEREEAIAAYESLVDDYPRAAASKPSLITLGQLHLSAARPARALEFFDRYLGTKGPLAEEAAYGRIRALRALGRTSEERTAIRSFVDAYPSSSYVGTLQKRLEP